MTCPVCNETVDVFGGCFCLVGPVAASIDELEVRDYGPDEDER